MGATVGGVAGVGWVLEGGGSWFVVSGFPPARDRTVGCAGMTDGCDQSVIRDGVWTRVKSIMECVGFDSRA